jgi:DNA-binding beta-propeller fold protein YncE
LVSTEERVATMDLSTGATLAVAEGTADHFAWSADSSTAVFVQNGGLMLWKREGKVLRQIGTAPASVARLAVDGRSESIYVAAGNGISRYHDGEAAMVLAPVTDASSLVLDAEGKSLYAVSPGEHQVLEIDALNGGAVLFAGDASQPVGVALTRDGSVLVADAERRAVLRYNRSSRALVATLELSFAPSRLDAIGDGVFVLNQRSKQEAMEVVALQPALAAFFVPAPQEN